jgi:hypothetical protein
MLLKEVFIIKEGRADVGQIFNDLRNFTGVTAYPEDPNQPNIVRIMIPSTQSGGPDITFRVVLDESGHVVDTIAG